MNVYIFDLDGTIALIHHRQHLVRNGSKKWKEFFAACVDDLPNHNVIRMANILWGMEDTKLYIFSGRSEDVRAETVAWLAKHNVPYDMLVMRPTKDNTPDQILKKKWLDTYITEHDNVRGVFDDRDKVVAMWRENGLTCFQVAPGDF